jgi:hypothetical protein
MATVVQLLIVAMVMVIVMVLRGDCHLPAAPPRAEDVQNSAQSLHSGDGHPINGQSRHLHVGSHSS